MKRKILFAVACMAVLFTVGQVQASYLFTTASATGRAGPTQAAINSDYSGTSLAGLVTVTGSGIQNWTVSQTGTYRITAAGAQGASGDPSYVGGRGALVSGDFILTSGQILQIAVGQAGLYQSSNNNGGGGGGSFVVDSLNNPLLVAGGGGGTRASVVQNGHDGQVSNYGTTSSVSSPGGGGVLKTTGLGLGGNVFYTWGSAGGGFNGDGAWDFYSTGGGSSWANGLLGGYAATSQNAPGGFGGGGAGNGSYGGGGGGGYSGGDGGRVAGGGGSFNLGANPFGAIGDNYGDGYVVIEALQVEATPEPTSLAIFGIGALCMGAGAARRRRKEKQAAEA